MSAIAVAVEFGGGLELLCGGKKSHAVSLPSSPATIRALIAHVRRTVIQERPELFVLGDSVRPGILVLINDADWELDGGIEAAVADGDSVVFISTLHGG